MRKDRIQSVILLKNQAKIADQCVVAKSFWSRLIGLMGRTDLKTGEGLLLDPCNDIHMWFMKIPIDVVFLVKRTDSSEHTKYFVSSFREGLKPWKLLPVRDWRAHITLELPVGTIQRASIQEGDELCIKS